MNQERFDELAKGLVANRLSRRQVLKGLVAGLVATALGPLRPWQMPKAMAATPAPAACDSALLAQCQNEAEKDFAVATLKCATLTCSKFTSPAKLRNCLLKCEAKASLALAKALAQCAQCPDGTFCMNNSCCPTTEVGCFGSCCQACESCDPNREVCVVSCPDCQRCDRTTGQCAPITCNVDACEACDPATNECKSTCGICDQCKGLTNPSGGVTFQCVPVDCGDPCLECRNGACFPKECNAGERCENGTCVPIDCGNPCLVMEEGQCVPVTCPSCQECDQQSGTCVPIDCGDPCLECQNDQCVPKECGPCQQCSDGSCVSTCDECSQCVDGSCASACGPCEECTAENDPVGGVTIRCVSKQCDPPKTLNPDTCQCECPVSCNPPQVPNPDTCQCECPSGQSECGGNCVDTSTDRRNCGTCGNDCFAKCGCGGEDCSSITGCCQGVCKEVFTTCDEGVICRG
jgi:CXCXC repeat